MVMVLEKALVEEMERIGRLRYPNEACGILLPEPHRGKWVWEIPNRSHEPFDSFAMHGEDLSIALEGYLPEPLDTEFLKTLTVWHTHPRGHVGPSEADMQYKPKYFKCLVVTLFDDEPAKATWF